MDADLGEGGVKNQPKSADVVYGRPLYKVAPKFVILGHFLSPKHQEFGGITVYRLGTNLRIIL